MRGRFGVVRLWFERLHLGAMFTRLRSARAEGYVPW
jgi:hypothetical protein